ncbi:MAG: undecaprenyl-diphosphate phosphatase [candidate division Zixibacteria bacterium]|nr:undecaprenyl-diphosphate phosphatase [candidate division Zixibacteria bacterium]
MSFLDALLLGILQGLTEFLPVSSSGHLVLAQALLGVKEPGVSFELLVHLGTLLAVFVYFRERIGQLILSVFRSEMKAERRIFGFLVIGTIPAGLAGVFLKDFFEDSFSSPILTSVMLIVTGLILLSTKLVKPSDKPMTLLSTVIMGIGQAAAIMPGISRSGSTISVGLLLGVKPEKAAEFSFLLAIPAILGAVVLKADELMALDSSLALQYLVGAVAAFVFGWLAVAILLRIIRRGKFAGFAYYCFAAGAFGLYLFQ